MAVLTLNRPDDRNPLNGELSEALLAALTARAGRRLDVRSVAIAADGHGVLRRRRPAPDEGARRRCRPSRPTPGRESIVELHRLALRAPKPLVARRRRPGVRRRHGAGRDVRRGPGQPARELRDARGPDRAVPDDHRGAAGRARCRASCVMDLMLTGRADGRRRGGQGRLPGPGLRRHRRAVGGRRRVRRDVRRHQPARRTPRAPGVRATSPTCRPTRRWTPRSSSTCPSSSAATCPRARPPSSRSGPRAGPHPSMRKENPDA